MQSCLAKSDLYVCRYRLALLRVELLASAAGLSLVEPIKTSPSTDSTSSLEFLLLLLEPDPASLSELLA